MSGHMAPAEIRLPIERSAFGRTSVQHIDSKSIFTPTSGFMSQYKFALNPYGGCAFGLTFIPSREMIAFADSSRFQTRVTARYQEGSVGAGTLGRLPLEAFDLLAFSAALPYHFEDWGPLLGALGSHEENAGKMILVVEPEAKADILDSFGRRLRARGWPTKTFCCHDLPEVIKRDDLPLKDMQEVWKRIGSPGSAPPRTWWNPPGDRFLIANPQPSWPLLGESRMALGGRLQGAIVRARPLDSF